MIVIEFVEAVEVMLDAAIKWIMLFAAIGSVLGLLGVWVVTRVVKWAWRTARRTWGSTGPRKALSARLPPELPSSDQNPAAPAERGSQPQWAHADKEAA